MGCKNSDDPEFDKEQAAEFLNLTKEAFNAVASRYKLAHVIKNRKAYYRRSTLRKHRDRNFKAK